MTESVLDLSSLSFLELTDRRREVLSALEALCADNGTDDGTDDGTDEDAHEGTGAGTAAAAAALGLGVRQYFEIERNREIRFAPTMSAIMRYTGVLFDALDVVSLDDRARAWLDDSVLLHSALFGLLRCADAIPAYRLSHDSKLPGLSLSATWRGAISEVLAGQEGFLLDLRSESYAKLGPASGRGNSFYLRVVTHTADGTKKAVTHFNKAGKGVFVRALAESGIFHDDVESLLDWARQSGISLSRGEAGELELAV